MFTNFKMILGILAVVLALIGIIMDSNLIMALMYLFLGLLFLVIGITEIKKHRGIVAVLVIILAGFNIIGSFYIILFEI